jgi:hypothetical protein
VLARAALEAAIPSRDVLVDLLNAAEPPPRPAKAASAAAQVVMTPQN